MSTFYMLGGTGKLRGVQHVCGMYECSKSQRLSWLSLRETGPLFQKGVQRQC